MTCILLGELKKNSCNCYTASSVEADVDQLWCTVICFILCVYLRVTRWFSGSLTFHPATVSPFALYFPPPVLHCLSLGRGKCQCTHLSIGRADPFRPGLHHMIKPGGGESIRLSLRHMQLAGYPGMENLRHETIWFRAQAGEPWPHLLGL